MWAGACVYPSEKSENKTPFIWRIYSLNSLHNSHKQTKLAFSFPLTISKHRPLTFCQQQNSPTHPSLPLRLPRLTPQSPKPSPHHVHLEQRFQSQNKHLLSARSSSWLCNIQDGFSIQGTEDARLHDKPEPPNSGLLKKIWSVLHEINHLLSEEWLKFNKKRPHPDCLSLNSNT